MGIVRVSNTTLYGEDHEGDHYWVSFDVVPKGGGESKSVYKGIMNGKGPRDKTYCVVKTKRCSPAKQTDWHHEVMASQKASQLADYFNTGVLDPTDHRVTFNVPFVALMDEVTDLRLITLIMGSVLKRSEYNRKLYYNEYVLIENYMRGDFTTLRSNNGWMSENPMYKELRAFCHFTWCLSGGHLVVADFQGLRTTNRFRLNNPVIHSTDQSYGQKDRGGEGILDFFRSHKCNEICNRWAIPLEMYDESVKNLNNENKHVEINGNYIRRSQHSFCDDFTDFTENSFGEVKKDKSVNSFTDVKMYDNYGYGFTG